MTKMTTTARRTRRRDITDSTFRTVSRALRRVKVAIAEAERAMAQAQRFYEAVDAERSVDPAEEEWTGAQCRRFRKLLGVSQTHVAAEAGFSRSHVCGIEHGQRRAPESIAAVRRALLRLQARATATT